MPRLSSSLGKPQRKISMPKKKSPKFPKTKELVRIAVNDGMTQIQIANLCRTQQGQVSKWKTGTALATRQQLEPLLELYGEKLRRTSFKLYQTEYLPPQPAQFARVEGKLILREKFRGIAGSKSLSAVRISVHDQKKDGFIVAVEVTSADYPNPSNRNWDRPLITDRHAEWFLFNGIDGIKRHALESLVAWSMAFGHSGNSAKFPGLRQLPFLLREALLNHGFELKDIEDFKVPV